MPTFDSGEQTRKITARTLEEAKQKLYDMYQYDYEITNRRTILNHGFLGFGQHEEVEVSYKLRNRGNTVPSYYSSSRPARPAYQPAASETDFLRSKEALLKNVEQQTGISVGLNSQLNMLTKKIDELGKKIDEKPSVAVSAEEHPTIERIEDLLSQNEFTHSYIKMISDRIKATFSLDQLEDFDVVQKEVVDWIGESISIAKEVVRRKPRTVIIVGPTGVGKTTTLVKLAAQNVISAKKNQKKLELCFITTDTMRVGAFEQLSRFGELFELKVKKAENAEDVKHIYESIKDSVDMIFIDTSGYSPNDASHIGMLKATLDVPGMNPEVYLALTASTKARDLKNIMQNYEPFGYKSVIITKCDESNQYGNVISVLNEKNKSISYITTGQKAAGCIEKANPVTFLIRLEDFKIDRDHIDNKFGDK